mgnify:CR=1 FL=1
MLDCHNLHGNRLEKFGPGQVKAVVMIDLDTFDGLATSEVSEIPIANIEGTSGSGNGDSVTISELASDEVLMIPCSTERLLSDRSLEMTQSEAESAPTSLEVMDAISQIIPCSQPVLKEHSYATTDGALLPASTDQNLRYVINDPTIQVCQPVDILQSSDMPTENVECSNAASLNSHAGSSLIPNSQSTLLDISNSFEEAVYLSRFQPNQEQDSGGIALSTGSDEMPQTDISTVGIDLNSSIESTQLPPSLTGNTNETEIIQSQNVDSYTTIQRTDDISLSTASLNIRTIHAQPNETPTATLLVSSIIQALQKQTNGPISEFSVKTVASQHAESFPLRELDNVRSSERQRRLLDNSVQVPVALQSPVVASLCDCSLEAGRADTRSGSSLKDAPYSKGENSTGKKETREERDERLKLQCERARLRQSQENETEREERRERDRKRQQLKRAREKRKGKLLHIHSQTQEKASYPVKQRKVAEDIPPEAGSSEDTGFKNDSNVTNITTAATPGTDSAAPGTSNDSDMHRKIDCLNKQMLYEIAEPTTSQTTSGLCTSQEDKGIPDQELTPKITTIPPEQKPSLPEDDLDLSKSAKVSGEGATVCGTNFIEQNDISSKKQAGDVKDESRLSENDKSRERMRKRRALESLAQRNARLEEQRERARIRRAEETDSQRETRRIKDRVRQQIKRTAESEENRSKRLTQQKEAMRRRRELATPQEKQDRQIKDRVRARKSRESKRAGQNPE